VAKGVRLVERFARQICLKEVGERGQSVLSNAHIVIIGLGGLGCPASQYLVGSGIGKLTLIDADTVSESNLHRQILFTEQDIGKSKVRCAEKKLRKLNRQCTIEGVDEALTPDNVSNIANTADIILDCADNFATSYVLSDFCYAHQRPLISASVIGFSGYVGGYCAGKPSLRALFPDLPLQSQNCASAGVMGAVVGSLGAMQAQFAINTLLALSPSPIGQMLTLDMRSFHQSSFRFDHASEPTKDRLLQFISCNSLSSEDWVVDLRTELKDKPTPSASNPIQVEKISIDAFEAEPRCPQPHQRAVFVCQTGLRAWRAARKLQEVWKGEIKLIALGTNPIS
jgi:molybdopterin/thiamine biosynthesis adenylyltransferase